MELRCHESFTAITSSLEQAEYGAFFRVTKARSGADGISFSQALEDQGHFLWRKPNVLAKWLGLRLRKSFVALLALPALHSFRSVKTCLHHLHAAVVARHFGLAFFGMRSQNDSGCHNPVLGSLRGHSPLRGSNRWRGGLVSGGASRKLNRRRADLSRRDSSSLE